LAKILPKIFNGAFLLQRLNGVDAPGYHIIAIQPASACI